MSKSFRASTVKLALVGVVVVLGAGGTVAGVAAASAVTHRAPPPVDHQLCYTASGPNFKIPSGVRLIDQFSPNGFVPTIVNPAVVHCNPVEKILPTGQVFPITNPNAHLACFNIKPPVDPAHADRVRSPTSSAPGRSFPASRTWSAYRHGRA